MQTQLKEMGYYTGPVDGIIGGETRRALREFQQKNGLEVNGKFTRATVAALAELNRGYGQAGMAEGES